MDRLLKYIVLLTCNARLVIEEYHVCSTLEES